MNKKITELMDQLGPDEIEKVNIKDEAGTELDERMQSISLERIRQLAMKGIEGELQEKTATENQIDMEREKITLLPKNAGKKRKAFSRFLLPIAAAVSLSLGVVAATQNPTLSQLFGHLFPYNDQVQPISESMSALGLTFTAEGAFIDEKTGLFIASFTKEDGSTFEEGTRANEMRLEMNQPNSMGWNTYNELSEDRKKLICIVNLSSSQKLYAKDLNLQAKNLMATRKVEADSLWNLSELEKMQIEGNWKNYDSMDGLRAEAWENIEGLNLDRIDLKEGRLEIITSFADEEGIQDPFYYFSLVNEKTGQVIEAADYEHYWSEEEGLNKDYTVFNGINEQDLENLKIRVMGQYDEIITEGSWNVSFKLDKNSQTISKQVNRMISVDEGKVFIRKIEVSALGVTINGFKLPGESIELDNIYLGLKNGSQVRLWEQGMNFGMGSFNIYLKGSTAEKSEPGLEENQQSVITDSTSSTVELDFEAFDWGQFIDIEQVQSIVIEGEQISLV